MTMKNIRDFENEFKVGNPVTVAVYDWYDGTQSLPGIVAEILNGGLYQIDIRVGMERHSVLAKRSDLSIRAVVKPAKAKARFKIGDRVSLRLYDGNSSRKVAGMVRRFYENSLQVDLQFGLDTKISVLVPMDDVELVKAKRSAK
jgi:hypothetical protein